MRPHSSLRGNTQYVRMTGMHSQRRTSSGQWWNDSPKWRLRDSVSFLRSLLIIELNSIRRASLRRSSCGLQRNEWAWPKLSYTTIFLGLAREFMTSTTSSNPFIHIGKTLVNATKTLCSLCITGKFEGKGLCSNWLTTADGKVTVRELCSGTIMGEGARLLSPRKCSFI